MAVIPSTSTSSKQHTVLEPCYRSRPLLPLSAYGFASTTFSAASSQSSTRRPLPGNSSTSASTSSVRFDVDRSSSTPSRSMTVKKPFLGNAKNQSNSRKAVAGTKKACLCSPSTHPGSFRCAMHKNSPRGGAIQSNSSSSKTASSTYHSSVMLNYRRLAMKNSLLRIGGVEGDLMKRALATPIRPTAHNQRRRVDFQPKPSRLSIMSKTTSG